jgi:hypothetical protein
VEHKPTTEEGVAKDESWFGPLDALAVRDRKLARAAILVAESENHRQLEALCLQPP